jgi:hypothetical protein
MESRHEIYGIIMPCDNVKRSFKSENQLRLWDKLHTKKCAVCASATTTEYNSKGISVGVKDICIQRSSPQTRMSSIIDKDINDFVMK